MYCCMRPCSTCILVFGFSWQLLRKKPNTAEFLESVQPRQKAKHSNSLCGESEALGWFLDDFLFSLQSSFPLSDPSRVPGHTLLQIIRNSAGDVATLALADTTKPYPLVPWGIRATFWLITAVWFTISKDMKRIWVDIVRYLNVSDLKTLLSNERYRAYPDQILCLFSERWSEHGELPWEQHWHWCAKKGQVKG